YAGTTAATIATRTLSGVLGTDAVSYNGGTAAFSDINVGTGKTVSATGLGLSGTNAGNYTVNSTATTTADITKRPITVTADAKSKYYNQSDPPLTYQITSSSLVNSDSFSGALTRDSGESVGQYNILQGTLTLSTNYTL